MSLITLEQVQRATARCLESHPARDAILSKESQLLAELLGRMIYARSEAIDAANLPTAIVEELKRWGALQKGEGTPSLPIAA